MEAAIRLSFAHEIPFLPQLPAVSQTELMLPAAVDGLPGVGADGVIDLAVWRRRSDSFSFAVDAALSTGDLCQFEPTRHACYQLFLSEIARQESQFAKVQIAGPATARWAATTSTGEPASDNPGLNHQLFRLLLAKALALVNAVKRAGASPILFLDEPLLGALNRGNPRHLLVLEELRLIIGALKKAGARVGLHCCANTAWAALLELRLDILSIDARLSLDAVLDEKTAFQAFLASGATLALGIIPTEPNAHFVVGELVDSVEVSVRSTTPRATQALKRMILTPACGLSTHTVAHAERVIDELAQAQRHLASLLEP